jgi:hypothetical protein
MLCVRVVRVPSRVVLTPCCRCANGSDTMRKPRFERSLARQAKHEMLMSLVRYCFSPETSAAGLEPPPSAGPLESPSGSSASLLPPPVSSTATAPSSRSDPLLPPPVPSVPVSNTRQPPPSTQAANLPPPPPADPERAAKLSLLESRLAKNKPKQPAQPSPSYTVTSAKQPAVAASSASNRCWTCLVLFLLFRWSN